MFIWLPPQGKGENAALLTKVLTRLLHVHVALSSSAETIPTLKNRESIHFAKFGHDTRADTLF